jgi:hypothetical protein
MSTPRPVVVPAHPGIAEDYKETFATAKGIIADVFLPPHPEMFGREETWKRNGR